MPSGKRAKQQRRVAAPPTPVKGGARQASPRALAVAGGVILLVILAVVLAIVLSSGGNGNASAGNPGYDGPQIHIVPGTAAVGNANGANAYIDAPLVSDMFKGIPQTKFVLGYPDAPVTLIEYIDLQCPVCKSFETTELGELVSKYVKTKKLKIEMKTWNIIDGHYPGVDDSLRGQKATIAAAQQNKAFDFAEVLYNNQGDEGQSWMTDGVISKIAESVDGLNTSQFEADANSTATANLIKSIDDYANSRTPPPGQPGSQRYPFAGTPTLFLQKGNGTPQYFGTVLPDLPTLEAAIDKLQPKK